MLQRLEIHGVRDPVLTRGAARLCRTFPGLRIEVAGPDRPREDMVRGAHAAPNEGSPGPLRRDGAVVIVLGRAWRDEKFDPLDLDRVVAPALAEAGRLVLRLEDEGAIADPATTVKTALEILTRYQRLLAHRNRHSSAAAFDEVLAVHRRMHDLGKPLVAADYDHALDTWRWALRLDPDASLEVQVAALFHDVERLVSEADERVEQHAPDYAAFKAAHAAAGARLVADTLAPVLHDDALVAVVADLVENHERGAGRASAESRLLNQADALSFFSLNACGFAEYYGPEHTRRKVAYTLARLDERGWRELGAIRHRADIAALIERLIEPPSEQGAGA